MNTYKTIDAAYNKSVMERAWKDYKLKKAHKGYKEWTFAESLHYAHRTIKALRKNGLYLKERQVGVLSLK